MKTQHAEELKKMILAEMQFRKEFRAKKAALEALVDPISRHVKECCKWWDENLPETEELIVLMDDGTSLKLEKPQKEDCTVETYLPFGVEYTACKIEKIGTFQLPDGAVVPEVDSKENWYNQRKG